MTTDQRKQKKNSQRENSRTRQLKDMQNKALLTAQAIEDELSANAEAITPEADYLKAGAPVGEEKCDDMMPTMTMPYGGAMTLADALAAMEAEEQSEAITEANALFQMVVSNILMSETITDKGAAISAAAKELQGLLKDPTPLMKEADAPLAPPTPEAIADETPATLWQKFRAFLHLDKQEKKTEVSTDKAGARHSVGDAADMQAMHDLTVRQGAECGMKVLKDADGNYRWFGWVSNKFRDRDTRHHPVGEIISEAAHKEFITWLDAHPAEAPEHWVWHTPQTAFKSRTDWWDYADGFLVMSGPMTAAEAKSYTPDEVVAMSHGFHALDRDKANGIINQYRMFENSDLPLSVAANPFTNFEIVRKEAEMPFTNDKRVYLVKRLGEERVTELEKDTAAMSKALEALGVDFKDAPAPPAPITPEAGDVTPLVEQLKGALNLDGLNQLLTNLQASNTQMAATLAAQAKELAELKKSDDVKVAETIKPRVTPMVWGYQASSAKDNMVTDPTEKAKVENDMKPSWVAEAFGRQGA